MFVSRDYISQIENGREPSARFIHQLELLEQVGLMPTQSAHAIPGGLGHEEQAAYGGRRVGIISWARAGSATHYEELPKDWQRSIYTECRDELAFAIEIEGDSMEKDYREGDIAIVMPSIHPRNHSLVIAKLKADGVVFKMLSFTGPGGKTIRLSSINPLYAPTDYAEKDFHWIYPVHSVTRMVWR